jgi:hypothetical protein
MTSQYARLIINAHMDLLLISFLSHYKKTEKETMAGTIFTKITLSSLDFLVV